MTTQPRPRSPVAVATGFTTCLLGDERTLREFVMGDDAARKLERQGRNVVLYLINDTYDPLNPRQLRIGVNRDPELMRLFSGFCGRPIAEVPDPFQCHESYAEHFACALMDRLHRLEIFPVLLDGYRAYLNGDYTPFVTITFESYGEIQAALRAAFTGVEPHDLFRVQCPLCSCLDATSILSLQGEIVTYTCRRCNVRERRPWRELRGKLTWKVDCAARWNLYDIQVETFAKSHVAPFGTFPIASFLSRHFFGGVVPEPVRYGHVRLDRVCAGRLLDILPPAALKRLLADNPTRDLWVTRDSVEGFCRKFEVRPGVSYVDWIRQELPRQAIRSPIQNGVAGPSGRTGEAFLAAYANRFSEFCYGRGYGLRLPNVMSVGDIDMETAALARDAIAHALGLRRRPHADPESSKAGIRDFLAHQPPAPRLHPYLRRIFDQEGGPALSSLLALLPEDHLNAVHALLTLMTTGIGTPGPWAHVAKTKEVES